MLGEAVVAGELLAGLDGPQSVEFDAVVGNPYIRVRMAGVIDETKRTSPLYGGVDGSIVHFHDGNSLKAFGPPPGFAQRDPFAGKLSDFLSRGNRRVSEQAGTFDVTFSWVKHGKKLSP